MRLCWADKIPLTLWLIAVGFLLFLGQTGPTPPAYANVTAAQHWGAFLDIVWIISYEVFIPLWVILRVLDLITAGPARRRSVVTVRRL